MKNFASFLLPVVLLTLAGCAAKTEKTELPASVSPRAATVVTLHYETVPGIYAASGTVAAKTTAALASQIMAQVTAVHFREGDHVHPGQILVTLNAQELDARYSSAVASREEAAHASQAADLDIVAAKANLDLVAVTHRRLQDLFEKRSISNQEFDESAAKWKAAEAAYEAAQARRDQLSARSQAAAADLRTAQISRGYSSIAAPFAGVIVARSVEPGAMAAPGVTLLTLEREGTYRLEVSVEESRLSGIQRGDRVPVQIDAFAAPIQGVVSEISPAADAQSHTFLVKLDLAPSPGLRSGLFGKALFPNGHENVLTVPVHAVTEHGQLISVLVNENNFARARLIATGATLGSRVVVLSGLRDGDQLIYPASGVTDGSPVEVRK